MNQTNQNGQNDKTITLMISELKTVIESMKAAVEGTTDDHDIDQIYSGSGESGSASGEYPIDDEEDATSINIITDPVLLNQPTDENSVDISEVIVIKPSDPETREIGGASYLHACVLLLIASTLVQLM